MKFSALFYGVLAISAFASSAKADPCKEMLVDGRAIHADLQRKAIAELNEKDYSAACTTMRQLTKLSVAMRSFAEQNCRNNEAYKRRLAAADNIATRTEEICAKAGR